MEIDINTSRERVRDGGGITTHHPGYAEGQKDSGFIDMMRGMLDDGLRQCLVLDDYERASSRWMMVQQMALRMGAPTALVLEYNDRLLAAFEKRREQAARPIQQNVGIDVNCPGNQIISRKDDLFLE